MLDDFLKDEDDTSSFLDDLNDEDQLFELPSQSDYGFLGMTAGQRFIVAILMIFVVLLSGAFCLLVTGSISLPAF